MTLIEDTVIKFYIPVGVRKVRKVVKQKQSRIVENSKKIYLPEKVDVVSYYIV